MAKSLSRRNFLGLSSAAAGASLAAKTIFLDPGPLFAQPQAVAASDRVRFGMIGIGMQGSGLMSNAVSLPGVECVAACDLYDGRHTLAREIANSPTLPVTRRYQELLDNKEIDCVIAAVPDHWHKQVVVDAVNAGKDVYCEKPMSHTPPDGVAMVRAAQASGRIVQIGSQRVSSVLFRKARELVEQGVLGDLMMVEASLGRNDPSGAWQYPPPPGLSPENLDWNTWLGTAPKIPFDPVRFARWRCWKEYGTGVAGDLLVHLVSGMIYVLGWNEAPKRAFSSGGILRWPDGRNMPDVQLTIFDYGKNPVYLRLNLGTETEEAYRFMGSKGILDITGQQVAFTPQSGKDKSPSGYTNSFPHAMRDAYVSEWHREHDPVPGAEPEPESVIFRSVSYDQVKPHLWNFFEAVKSRKPVVEDAVFGHHAATACHMANLSYFTRTAVSWDEASESIQS